jgi:hypothetical protein
MRMIRLREALQRARRHRWLGPLVIILLVLLVAFIAFHEGSEKLFGSAGELCIAVAVVVVSLVRARPQIVGRPSRAFESRAPPVPPVTLPAGGVKLSISLAPLRL